MEHSRDCTRVISKVSRLFRVVSDVNTTFSSNGVFLMNYPKLLLARGFDRVQILSKGSFCPAAHSSEQTKHSLLKRAKTCKLLSKLDNFHQFSTTNTTFLYMPTPTCGPILATPFSVMYITCHNQGIISTH